VDLGNKKTGLVHVKQLGRGFVEDASTLFKVGETMEVEVLGEDKGKIQLKAANPPAADA